MNSNIFFFIILKAFICKTEVSFVELIDQLKDVTFKFLCNLKKKHFRMKIKFNLEGDQKW